MTRKAPGPIPPAYVGMPPTDRIISIKPYGKIRCGGVCRDDYARIKTITDPPRSGRIVTLQQAALLAFRDAEAAVGFTIEVTGTMRSCAYQAHLYASDPHRFAAPNTTAHCRGLAIDVSQSMSKTKLKAIGRALKARRWYQARPVDEPWHYSFGIQV